MRFSIVIAAISLVGMSAASTTGDLVPRKDPRPSTCNVDEDCKDTKFCYKNKCRPHFATGLIPADKPVTDGAAGSSSSAASSGQTKPRPSTCAADEECKDTNFCYKGKCRAKFATGGRPPVSKTQCTANEDCTTNLCIGGFCAVKGAKRSLERWA